MIAAAGRGVSNFDVALIPQIIRVKNALHFIKIIHRTSDRSQIRSPDLRRVRPVGAEASGHKGSTDPGGGPASASHAERLPQAKLNDS